MESASAKFSSLAEGEQAEASPRQAKRGGGCVQGHLPAPALCWLERACLLLVLVFQKKNSWVGELPFKDRLAWGDGVYLQWTNLLHSDVLDLGY